MNYAELRNRAQTGDVILLKGHGPGSLIIRVLTGESFSHVGLLTWLDAGLWIIEARSLVGIRLTPASQWVEHHVEDYDLFYAPAPMRVRTQGPAVSQMALAQRWRRYSPSSLVVIWLARIFRLRLTVRLVCSTLVGVAWEASGVTFPLPPVPGDIADRCAALHRIS